MFSVRIFLALNGRQHSKRSEGPPIPWALLSTPKTHSLHPVCLEKGHSKVLEQVAPSTLKVLQFIFQDGCAIFPWGKKAFLLHQASVFSLNPWPDTIPSSFHFFGFFSFTLFSQAVVCLILHFLHLVPALRCSSFWCMSLGFLHLEPSRDSWPAPVTSAESPCLGI